jgi:hypothetical protein
MTTATKKTVPPPAKAAAVVKKRAALPAPKRLMVDGLTVYAVDRPGPAYCGLMFRVGKADETLPSRGITHMVEHLALFGQSDSTYHLNGFVDAHRTAFHADGTEDECLDFLTGVTEALVDLPMHRLEQERRVLEAEEAGSRSGLFGDMVINRFGARGFGLLAYDQLGLQNFDATDLARWAGSRFTAGNAVLVLSGVDPRRVSHVLPPGERWPVVESETEDDLPGWFLNRSGRALGLTMVARRSPALSLSLRVLEKRLLHRLRTEMAIVYSVVVEASMVEPDIDHVYIACEPVDGRADDAQAAIEHEVALLASEGPRVAEVDADRAAVERSWSDPDVGLRLAHLMATDELLGNERRTPAAIRKAELAVSAQEVSAALAVARQTAVWALPPETKLPSGARPIAQAPPDHLDGRRLAATPRGMPSSELVLADSGIGVKTPHGWRSHVEYRHCVGALAWRDGTRVLIGEDGYAVTVHPWEWRGGEDAVTEIDAKVDATLVVPMGEGGGPPPAEPAVQPVSTPHHRRSPRRVILAVVFALFALGTVALPLLGPSVKAADVPGVPAAIIPVDSNGYVRCGGSSLSIWRHRAVVPDVGPSTATIAAVCQDESRNLLVACGFCLVVTSGIGGWYVSDRRRARTAAAR